jgi:hypothetical protein
VLVVRALLGVRLMGVPARRFFAALGNGVPLDLRGLPLRFGVARGSCESTSSSMDSLSGTVVVVVRTLGRTDMAGLGDWNSRLLAVVVVVSFPFSVSTVTSSF